MVSAMTRENLGALQRPNLRAACATEPRLTVAEQLVTAPCLGTSGRIVLIDDPHEQFGLMRQRDRLALLLSHHGTFRLT